MPRGKLLAYPRESVVAEKFEAMVSLGLANSRMKDFYSVWSLSHDFSFRGPLFADAFEKTFTRRETQLPKQVPLVFTPEFFRDENKKNNGRHFATRTEATCRMCPSNRYVMNYPRF
jgi:hypothetical protein